ncbi:MAG: polysaccharide pyruvyl transferase family protein [Ilumatobacteraceae bacterium]
MAADEPRAVFVSLVAQHDNLGDLVIRREMVRWLTAPTIRLHALVAGVPDDFLAAIDLPATAVLHRTPAHWQAALLTAAANGRSGLVFAPGPQALQLGARGLAHEVVNLANAAALRARGNPVAKTGRSLRGHAPTAVRLERGVHRLSREYWLRDEPSAQCLGRDVQVLPDISLAEGAVVSSPGAASARTVVAVSPRHDRGWSPAEVAALATDAGTVGQRLVLVTQVRRDEPGHAALAAATGVDHLAWGDRSTEQQLARVVELYAQSSLVIADRLHAVLFGLACGATPMPRHAVDDKLHPALATLGLPAGLPTGETGLADALDWRQRHAAAVADARRTAADTLGTARIRLRRLFGADDD